MQVSFESNGAATPEFRAAILGELVRHISVQLTALPYGEALSHIMKASACTEEQVGGEVLRAWFLLDRSWIMESSQFGVISAGTTAKPTPFVTDYIWEDQVWMSRVEEGA